MQLCREKWFSYMRLGVGQEGGVFTMSFGFCFHLVSPWYLLNSFIVQVSSNDPAIYFD